MDSSNYEDIAKRGWTFVDSWLNSDEVSQIRSWGELHLSQFRKARVVQQTDAPVRGDFTLWLAGDETPVLHQLFQKLQDLRTHLNQELMLPMNNFECHLAYYPPGTSYPAHLDQKQQDGTGERLVSAVIYLNEKWKPDDAGRLLIHSKDPDSRIAVKPVAGRLVLFRSQDIWHEVETTNQGRWSLTVWFRRDSF